ncbi:type III restriction endonuclease subunit R, partial [Enterococcus faecalis]|nr:type III restriction endonuclease subunit R [Enterococcus faecalis]
VSLPKGQHISDLSAIEKLEIIDKFLVYCEEKIRKNYQKEIGLKVFKPISIKDTLRDYEVVVPLYETGHITQRIELHQMKGKDWFVYTDAIMNRLEYAMVELMGSFIHELEAKYKQVYLIRNDEKATRYKLTEFGGPRGFMPDFILYLENEEFVYQVFIEPKGEDREKEDAWKQEMLYAMNDSDIEIIGENDNVKLVGVKFYNNKNKRKFIIDLSEKINDGVILDGKLELFSGE